MSFGAFLGGALDFAGGLVGAKASRDNTKDSINFQRDQMVHSEEVQREFAQNSIRWRKEDAEAAGLHPLYAINGAGASFTPSAATVNFDNGGQDLGRALSRAGQNVTRAVQAQQTPEQRAYSQAQLRLLESQLGESDARRLLLIAQAKKAEIEAAQATAFPDTLTDAYGSSGVVINPVTDGTGPRIQSHPLYRDAVKLKGDDMVSRDARRSHVTAGRGHPGWREFDMGGGFKMLKPATDGGGMPEEIDVTMIPEMLAANVHTYGWRWLPNYLAYLTGRDNSRWTLEGWLRSRRTPRDHGGDFSIGGRSRH